MAAFAHEAAKHYGVNIALHTDHCQKEVLDEYVRPLLAISQERVDRGENPLFQSHMWDASPSTRTWSSPRSCWKRPRTRTSSSRPKSASSAAKRTASRPRRVLISTLSPEDFEKTIDALGTGEKGRYMLAATFGNVHGVYKPGNVKLRPEVLLEGQKVAQKKLGLGEDEYAFDFVFHGGRLLRRKD